MGGGGLGCHKFKSLGKLSNSWTDWQNIWHTSADPPGNGYTPNTGVKHSKVLGSCQTTGPTGTNFGSRLRIHLGMDIGYIQVALNTPGAFRGVIGGHKFKCLRKLSNDCTDWHHIWYTSADSSGNGHRQTTIRPQYPRGISGGYRGSQIQMSGEAVKRLERLAPNLVHAWGFVWEWT